jgi:hypothetical protein
MKERNSVNVEEKRKDRAISEAKLAIEERQISNQILMNNEQLKFKERELALEERKTMLEEKRQDAEIRRESEKNYFNCLIQLSSQGMKVDEIQAFMEKFKTS